MALSLLAKTRRVTFESNADHCWHVFDWYVLEWAKQLGYLAVIEVPPREGSKAHVPWPEELVRNYHRLTEMYWGKVRFYEYMGQQ